MRIKQICFPLVERMLHVVKVVVLRVDFKKNAVL